MTEPPQDPHTAETQIGRPAGPPPPPYTPPTPPPYTPPPPYAPPPSQGPSQGGWTGGWTPGQPPGPPLAPPPGPPSGPPPGWQGGYGGPPPARSKLPWILAAVVVVLLLGGGGLTAALLLGDDDSDDRSARSGRSQDPAPTAPAAPTAPTATAASPTDDPTSSPTTDPGDPGPSDDLLAVVGSWSGTYDCAQGDTAMDLTIAPAAEAGRLEAVFAFGPTPDNPAVAPGSFLMEGTFNGTDVVLVGTTWIDQPDGYELIDLQATVVSPTASTLSGIVTTPGCGGFEISR